MKFLLNAFDLNDYFEKLNKIGFINKSSKNCYEFEVLKKFGQGKIKRYSFKNGLDVSMINMKLNQELNYSFELENKFFEIVYVKAGYIEVFDKNTGKYRLNAGECIINLKEEMSGWVRYPKDVQLEYLTVYIEEEYLDFINGEDDTLKRKLKEYRNKNINMKNREIIFKIINPDTKRVLNEIWNCNFQNGLKKMYIQAKAGEVFCEVFCEFLSDEFIRESTKRTPISLSRDDIKRLYYAKEIITEKMTEPPSLIELSKQICLNTYKLKVGFKRLFSNTVYGYLQEIRMEKARNLLKNTNLNISDISLQVGYSNSSNFSTVFKKKYGISPKEYRKL